MQQYIGLLNFCNKFRLTGRYGVWQNFMADFGPFLFLAVIVLGFFYLRKRNKENRHRYHDILREFQKNNLYRGTNIHRDNTFKVPEEYIITYFENYFIRIYINGTGSLEISMQGTCSGRPRINIVWEPVSLTYSSLKHIGYHLSVQAADIFSGESSLSHDRNTSALSYSRKIPVERRHQYENDLESWANSKYDL